MTTYLIDFENVKSKGLVGIEAVSKQDKVIILYSENSDTISFDMHQKVLESDADIEYMKVRVGLKNALDFQLSTLLGYMVAKGENSHIFVISNDKGFDRLHDFWTGNEINENGCIVYRTQNIAKATEMIDKKANDTATENADAQVGSEDTAVVTQEQAVINDTSVVIKKTPVRRGRRPQKSLTELITELLGDSCNADDIEQIKVCLLNAESKEDFHNSMAKIFKQQATDYYKLLRPKYARLKNLSNRENDIADTPKTDNALSKELTKLLGKICNKDDITKIEQCMRSTKTKQALYISMLKIYKRERGCEIYKLLKPEYSNLVNLIGG